MPPERCPTCGSKLVTTRVHSYKYTACGLDNVTLYGVEVADCDGVACEARLVLPRIEELHRKLAAVLVAKAKRTAAEVRFLQKWLEGEAFEPTPPEALPYKEIIAAKNGSQWWIEIEQDVSPP